MFTKTLDSKKTYFIDDVEVVDLGDTIFNPNVTANHLYTLYKARKEYNMRPDLVSQALYGTTDYTEMVLKYSLINNPFSIEEGDMIFATSMSTIYQAVKDTDVEKNIVFDAVKNYHKYIDKNKVPNSPGSDTVKDKTSINNNNNNNNLSNNNKTANGFVEANISKTGNSGITIKDGKLYFGSVEDSVSSTDSPIVDCAVNGTTLGEFLNATLRNAQ